ncbi:YjhX family toxin, partial [Pseudomonas aeruginosa]
LAGVDQALVLQPGEHRQGRPYRISMAGLKAVRPQADNR